MRNSARFAAPVLAAALAAFAGQARACGACAEDRVAAVYDHAVVEGAARRGHGVAFLALEGSLPFDGQRGRAVRAALAAATGVDRGTVRVSVENASCSAAFDPARASVETIVAEVNRRLARRGLAVASLRIGGGGKAMQAD